ncbi:DUF3888 domain-containing protein [Bacillus sp. MRMR6]|uniref:DUF3888 domain-containing protein n=1 Tax=Bacillus sp. MRMR6 TaxID=1928617 RepID=UPI00095336E9|nr:DUF3888 domain-containing protein [Bacillus sp. MRMR6]OLS33339.1 hypothetical protein BTR25_26505 [Bacillus sp. MRMR6]
MKKTITLILTAILICTPFSFVKAEGNQTQKDKTEPHVTPATANDFLLDFVRPKVNEIITKEYGKDMQWNWVKVTGVNYIVSNEPKSCYEVNTIVTVEDYDKKESKFKFDSITLRVNPKDSNFVELVQYKQNVNEKDTH